VTAADERRGAGIHEAGRAVVAWALELKVRRIAIGVGGDLPAGETDIEEKQSMSLIDRIALSTAGGMAQHTFKAPNGISTVSVMDKIRDLIGERDEIVRSELRQIGFEKSYELLSRHRDKVARLADALSDRLVLTQPEIAALLEDRSS
jgi:ATP-dependent Zn protease